MDNVNMSFETWLRSHLEGIPISMVDPIDEDWVKDMILEDIEHRQETEDIKLGSRTIALCELSVTSCSSGSFDNMSAY